MQKSQLFPFITVHCNVLFLPINTLLSRMSSSPNTYMFFLYMHFQVILQSMLYFFQTVGLCIFHPGHGTFYFDQKKKFTFTIEMISLGFLTGLRSHVENPAGLAVAAHLVGVT